MQTRGIIKKRGDERMEKGSFEIDPPVMNAACSIAKTPEDVQRWRNTETGAVLVGSITVEPREGNPEPRWFTGEDYALNSFGMPNAGMEYYRRHLPDMISKAHQSGKEFALSIAGFSPDEYVQLAKMADVVGVDILELNFGCPNVSESGQQKPIASFDPDTMVRIAAKTGEVTDIPRVAKLSPYSDPGELNEVADAVIDSQNISAVATSNTFPCGVMLRGGEPVLAAGRGGVSGRGMLPIALGQVQQFRERLPESMDVIGVGGIESAEDAELYFQVGATAVQAATMAVRDGHEAINRIVENGY
jgi:dihydroorotate dehydrogenase (fumarate)